MICIKVYKIWMKLIISFWLITYFIRTAMTAVATVLGWHKCIVVVHSFHQYLKQFLHPFPPSYLVFFALNMCLIGDVMLNSTFMIMCIGQWQNDMRDVIKIYLEILPLVYRLCQKKTYNGIFISKKKMKYNPKSGLYSF